MNKNKQVVVSLKGALENGDVFEQTPEDHPLLLILGQSTIFPVLEKALDEMRPGDTREITLAPEEAYGPHHQDLVQTIDQAAFSGKIQPAPGMILSLKVEKDGGEEKVPATVVSVANGKVTVDYNHPLAGKPVVYTLTMHSIRE
jgi:FKBP-type peptidyl-prolyl cis-trans isomerase 2